MPPVLLLPIHTKTIWLRGLKGVWHVMGSLYSQRTNKKGLSWTRWNKFTKNLCCPPGWWHQEAIVMVANMHGQSWLSLACEATSLKEALTGKSRSPGAEGTPRCFSLHPQSVLFSAVLPAWPQPHGHRALPHSGVEHYVSFCSPQNCFSSLWSCPWRATILALVTAVFLPSLSWSEPQLGEGAHFIRWESCPQSYGNVTAGDLSQHFCSQCSDSGPHCIWSTAWMTTQGWNRKREATLSWS